MATTLKEILDSLPDHQRRLLMYAFEQDLEQWIETPDGHYIGVNTSKAKNLIPDLNLSQGRWATGIVKPRK